jgi:Family of unknown function (DUF6114)
VSTPPGRDPAAGGPGGDPAARGPGGPGGEAAARWRQWRHTRPFWGGVFVIAGGTVTLLSERAPLPLMVHIGVQGAAGYLVPLVLLLCGLLLWFNPAQRTFYSILAVLLALGSWITSNLGGFFAGMLLGVLGGSLGFAWEHRDSPPAARPARPAPPAPPRPAAGLSIILGPHEPQSPPEPGPEPKPAPAGPAPEPGPHPEPEPEPAPGPHPGPEPEPAPAPHPQPEPEPAPAPEPAQPPRRPPGSTDHGRSRRPGIRY